MTLGDIFKIQSIIDKRATPHDIEEFLEQEYFSNSKSQYIKYKDIHITHFIRIFIVRSEENVQENYDELMKLKKQPELISILQAFFSNIKTYKH